MEKDDLRTTALWITLASLLLWSCSGLRAAPQPLDPTPAAMDPAALEQAKQDIYRMLASGACGSGVVYIYPEIARYPLEYSGSNTEYVLQQLPEASPEIWESYRRVNDPAQPTARFSDFPIDCQYEFVSSTDVVCAGPITDCIIPLGYSDIAFNSAGTLALVYVYTDCSECGGQGNLLLLEKQGGEWTIINGVALWVS
jgi:hypothetical protein